MGSSPAESAVGVSTQLVGRGMVMYLSERRVVEGGPLEGRPLEGGPLEGVGLWAHHRQRVQ